ncbi:MAG: prepilin-type N-terminal cleavage/methylation domain-containing protein, partial [Patescibacteria group bacterium]
MVSLHENKKFYHSRKEGFTLIETLVGSVVFALVALSAYQAFSGLMDGVSVSRAKIAATSLVNEQLEIIRNLAYDNVGIESGLPAGTIERTQTLLRDNYSFTVTTTIRNIDDPFDGTIGGNPSDTSPADYKSVDLDITCSNCKRFNPIKFTTLVAPYALETASTNGALFMQVIDAQGVPIQGASVHLVNTQTNPDIIIDETTDNGGWIKIVDAPPGVNAYNIIATKSGYTTDQTYPPGGVAGADPINPDATVVIQQVTQTSFSIDRISTLAVSSVDAACAALPN